MQDERNRIYTLKIYLRDATDAVTLETSCSCRVKEFSGGNSRTQCRRFLDSLALKDVDHVVPDLFERGPAAKHTCRIVRRGVR